MLCGLLALGGCSNGSAGPVTKGPTLPDLTTVHGLEQAACGHALRTSFQGKDPGSTLRMLNFITASHYLAGEKIAWTLTEKDPSNAIAKGFAAQSDPGPFADAHVTALTGVQQTCRSRKLDLDVSSPETLTRIACAFQPRNGDWPRRHRQIAAAELKAAQDAARGDDPTSDRLAKLGHDFEYASDSELPPLRDAFVTECSKHR